MSGQLPRHAIIVINIRNIYKEFNTYFFSKYITHSHIYQNE